MQQGKNFLALKLISVYVLEMFFLSDPIPGTASIQGSRNEPLPEIMYKDGFIHAHARPKLAALNAFIMQVHSRSKTHAYLRNNILSELTPDAECSQ